MPDPNDFKLDEPLEICKKESDAMVHRRPLRPDHTAKLTHIRIKKLDSDRVAFHL